MHALQEVDIQPRESRPFDTLQGVGQVGDLMRAVVKLRRVLGDGVVWNVAGRAVGVGAPDMMRSLFRYANGMGVDARWITITGDTNFNHVIKRLHNALHGELGDGSPLGIEERVLYERTLAQVARELSERVSPGDVVILHDPATAGLIPALRELGATVIWRCHGGGDLATAEGLRGWRFLKPYLTHGDTFVFSRNTWLPDCCDNGRVVTVTPSIDPFYVKNQPLEDATVRSILAHAGIIAGPTSTAGARVPLTDGAEMRVIAEATVLRDGTPPAPDTPLIVQIARWDRLKDARGVMEAFCRVELADGDEVPHLVLAGPEVAADDDPESLAVYNEVVEHWSSLPEPLRARVHLVSLPSDDRQQNAAIVNALQRHATVVVQKSLCDGFGVSVTEAMFKGRAVVASAVGGLRDQIDHEVSGLLIEDPADIGACTQAFERLLQAPALRERMGANARRTVEERYLGLRSLLELTDVVERAHRTNPLRRRVPERRGSGI